MNRESLPLALSLPKVSKGHTHPIIKRKRGGQKGNQNARKHGFYSALTAEEIAQFWNLTAVAGLDPVTAVIRLKLQSSLERDQACPERSRRACTELAECACPERSRRSNTRVISQASRLLAKWCRAKYSLDRTETNHLKMIIGSILSARTEPACTEPACTELARTEPACTELACTELVEVSKCLH